MGCWGCDVEGATCDPVGTAFTSVVAGARHSCGIDEAGLVHCWGAEDYAGSGMIVTTPSGIEADQVVVGDYFTCVLADGEPTCWGEPSDLMLDIPDGPFTELLAGCEHVCAYNDVRRELTCWGGGGSGGELDLFLADVLLPASGCNHVCFVVDDDSGDVRCYGDGFNNPTIERPFKDDGDIAITALQAGGKTTCAIAQGDEVADNWSGRCWEPIDGDSEDVVAGWGDFFLEHTLVSLSIGDSAACGLTDDGRILCSQGGSTCQCSQTCPEDQDAECTDGSAPTGVGYPP